MKKRLIVACEYSGIVREAFKAKGWDAWSCDLLPTEIEGQHFQEDIFEVLKREPKFDMMIAHPPCTYLSYVGNSWLDDKKYGEKAIQRHKNREAALKFFMDLLNADIAKICVENPKGYPMQFVKPTQIIQPYFFGDNASKATCLWLKNLPKLIHQKESNMFYDTTHATPEVKYRYKTGKRAGKPIYFNDAFPPSKDRAKLRSKTFLGIAAAFADQWGNL